MSTPKTPEHGDVQLEVSVALSHVPRTPSQIARIASQRLGRPVHRSTIASALTRLEGFGCASRVGRGLWAEPNDILSEVRRCPD